MAAACAPPPLSAADAKVGALVGLFDAFLAEEAGRMTGADPGRRRLVVDPTPLRLALAVPETGFGVGVLSELSLARLE